MGGDLYTNRNPDTHSETHTDRSTDIHTDTHSVFSPSLWRVDTNVRPTGQVGNW